MLFGCCTHAGDLAEVVTTLDHNCIVVQSSTSGVKHVCDQLKLVPGDEVLESDSVPTSNQEASPYTLCGSVTLPQWNTNMSADNPLGIQ